MIQFDNIKIGSYVYTQTDSEGKKHSYKIEMRSGNCDSVHVRLQKEIDGQTWIHLVNFIGDAQHLRNMEKYGYDIFENCTNIRLNVYFEQNVRLMRYATKFGHNVSCYYKEI